MDRWSSEVLLLEQIQHLHNLSQACAARFEPLDGEALPGEHRRGAFRVRRGSAGSRYAEAVSS